MTVAFSKAELRLTIPFELLPVWGGGEGGGFDAASGKISRISTVSVFSQKQSRTKKVGTFSRH